MILGLDFETEPISDVPDGLFPKPVGMALSTGKKPIYMAWGHPTENNCTLADAKRTLMGAVKECDTLVAHNIGFDVGVAAQWLGVGLVRLRWHDSQVMAFHEDPHSPSLGLKPLSVRYLGMPPDEQDELRAWLLANKLIRSNVKDIGKFIYLTPGKLCGQYAIGDVDRALKLFRLWRAKYAGKEGYERDMKATRVGGKMTARGVRIDTKKLKEVTSHAEDQVEIATGALAKEFGMARYDPNDREGLADAIESKFGIALPLTPKGRRQTNKDALFDHLPDGRVKALIRYIGAVAYDLKNYLRPWVLATNATGGLIHPHWSVTRSDEGGARSGRLSSSPNLQNLRGVEGTEELVKYLALLYAGTTYWFPMIRDLVIAPEGMVIIGRDWSQIELRLVAHYEGGVMNAEYNRNPKWDLHAWVMARVKELFGKELIRRVAKNIGFGSIYGAGAVPIAKQSRISIEEAYEFKRMYFEALPSLKVLMDDVMDVARVRPITTLGNRIYHAEPPRFNPATGRMQEYYYKMLNYLIQPSAADLMKEAMNDADDYGVNLIMTVHDEPVAICTPEEAEDHGEALRVAMEHNDLVGRITVPITSSGYVVNRWGDAEH